MAVSLYANRLDYIMRARTQKKNIAFVRSLVLAVVKSHLFGGVTGSDRGRGDADDRET